jgi:hypothetical protein
MNENAKLTDEELRDSGYYCATIGWLRKADSNRLIADAAAEKASRVTAAAVYKEIGKWLETKDISKSATGDYLFQVECEDLFALKEGKSPTKGGEG